MVRLEGRKALIDAESEIDRLYSVPVEEFTALRKEIAMSLRAKGQDEAAERISKLKKPSVSAWLVNQLARTRELDVQRLLRSGEALEEAQRALLSGSAGTFEAARREEAAAVSLLKAAAKDILPNATVATLDRVTQTLRSATSAAARSQLKAGRLVEDLKPPGFEAFSAHSAAPASKASKGSKRADSKRIETLTTQRTEAASASASQAKAANELDRLANEAELEAKRARQRADAARKKAAAAAEDLARISAQLKDLT